MSLTGNYAADDGGGIESTGGPLIIDSIITNNTAGNFAGGVDNAGPFTIINCTITDNSAANGGGLTAFGGGELDGSIVANNTGGDIYGTLNGSNNLIGDGSGNWTSSANNIMGSSGSPIDPLLAPLDYYGGPTQTMPPMANSPVIGTGDGNFDYFNFPLGNPYLDDVPITADERGYALSSPPDIGAAQSEPAPIDLQVTGTSATEVDLSWTNTDSAATAIDILVSTDGVNYHPFASVAPADLTSPMPSTYAATGLDSGTFYWFEVESDESGFRSAPSNAVPEDSTGVATPQNVSATATSSTAVSLTWKDRTGTATWFELQRSPDAGADWSTVGGIGEGSSTSGTYTWADTTVTDGTDYLYRIIGHDNAEDSSVPSQPAEVITPVVPPTGLTASDVSDSEIDLSWTDHSAGATGDIIEMSTTGTAGSFYELDEIASVSAGSSNSYAATGLDSGTSYWFEIEADSGVATSTATSSASASTPGIPEPQDLTATAASPTEVDLSWDDPAGLAATFDVQRSSDGGNSWGTIASGLTAISGSNTYADTSANDGTDYLYQIVGRDSYGNWSNPSDSAEAVTPLVVPTDLNVSEAVDANSIDGTLTWQENSNSGSDIQYEIDRSTDNTNWTVLTVTDSGDTSNTYEDDGLIGQADYYYRIQAINSVATSDYSASYHLTTETSAPATPSNFAAGAVTDHSIALNWAAGTDPGGAASGYTVSMSSDEGQSWNVYTPSGGALGSSATGVTVTGLNLSTLYLFEVTADNAAGSSYAAGPIGAKTPALAEGTPVLSVSQNTTDSRFEPWTSLHLSWTYNGDDAPNCDFQIKDTTLGENFHELGDNYTSSFSEDSSGTSGTVYGLTAGDSYIFRMRQDYADDTVSAWSTTSAIAPPLATPTPNVSVTQVGSGSSLHLVVGWSGTPSGGLVQIEFQSDAYPNAGWFMFDPDPSADDHYPVDTGSGTIAQAGDQGSMINPGVINNAGVYTYRVRGFVDNGGAWGDAYGQPTAWSTPQSGSLPEGTSPAVTAGAVTDSSVTLNWTGYAAAYNTTSYYVGWEGFAPGFQSITASYYPSYQAFGARSVDASGSSIAISQAMSYTITGLQSGVSYHFVLETQHSDGTPMGYTDITQATSGAVVPGPDDSNDQLTAGWSQSANSGSGAVALYWSDHTVNEAGFEIERSADPSFPNNSLTTTFPLAADQASYIDSTAGEDSSYYYRLRAVGDSSGYYDLAYTNAVRVDTPGATIAVDSPLDPAGNPQLNNLGPVKVTVSIPLGAYQQGNASFSWSPGISLFADRAMTIPIGTDNAASWTISSGSGDTVFYAITDTASDWYGDQSFALTTDLNLYSATQLVENPATTQTTTSPGTYRLTTSNIVTIESNGVDVTDQEPPPGTAGIILPGSRDVFVALYNGPGWTTKKITYNWEIGNSLSADNRPNVLSSSTIVQSYADGIATPVPAAAFGKKTLSFYWVTTSDPEVYCVLTVDGVTFTPHVILNFIVPTVTFGMTQWSQPTHFVDEDFQQAYGISNEPRSPVDDPRIMGRGSVSLPTGVGQSGDRWAFTQTIRYGITGSSGRQNYAYGEPGTPGADYNGMSGLDDEFVWNKKEYKVGDEGIYSDAPDIETLGIGAMIHYNTSFNSFVIFKPQGGIYVALREIDWNMIFDVSDQPFPGTTTYGLLPIVPGDPGSLTLRPAIGSTPVIKLLTYNKVLKSPAQWYPV